MNRTLTSVSLLLAIACWSSETIQGSRPSDNDNSFVNRAGYETAHRSSISPQDEDVSEAGLKVFIAALKKAVAADDRRKVASMIRYPIVIVAGGRSVLFSTPASLVASYNLVFTPLLKKLIAHAKPQEMFRNWQGAMIGRGEIWINTVSAGRLKVVTIQAQTEQQEKAVKPRAPGFKVHPSVFSMIFRDVREIDLDAVAHDHQFQDDDVKQDGEWIFYSEKDGRGFSRYRVLKKGGNRYTVQYQENGGGTITDSAIIEFVIDRRLVRKDGKLESIRVLRVLRYTDE
jgi:hypothetical protein